MTDALPRRLLIGVGCHLICQSGKLPQVRTWKSRLRVNVCESVTERESCWSSWYTVLLTNLLHHMTMSQTSYPSAASLNNNITRSSSAPVKMNQFKYWKHCFCFYLPSCPPPPLHPSVQMWSRWPSTGLPETSTLWMTWMTGSSCVTRMGRHVSPSWTRSCTTLKASPWTPPWGQFHLLLSVSYINTHTHKCRHRYRMCARFLSVPTQRSSSKGFMQTSDWCQISVICRCYPTLKQRVEMGEKAKLRFGRWSNWVQMLCLHRGTLTV